MDVIYRGSGRGFKFNLILNLHAYRYERKLKIKKHEIKKQFHFIFTIDF